MNLYCSCVFDLTEKISYSCSLLVFENIENGSLKDHLTGNYDKNFPNVSEIYSLLSKWLLADPLRTPLNWRTRRQIAVGVAAALVRCQVFKITASQTSQRQLPLIRPRALIWKKLALLIMFCRSIYLSSMTLRCFTFPSVQAISCWTTTLQLR